jgi:hypothetical protein
MSASPVRTQSAALPLSTENARKPTRQRGGDSALGGENGTLAMQKVVGSNPISRFIEPGSEPGFTFGRPRAYSRSPTASRAARSSRNNWMREILPSSMRTVS